VASVTKNVSLAGGLLLQLVISIVLFSRSILSHCLLSMDTGSSFFRRKVNDDDDDEPAYGKVDDEDGQE